MKAQLFSIQKREIDFPYDSNHIAIPRIESVAKEFKIMKEGHPPETTLTEVTEDLYIKVEARVGWKNRIGETGNRYIYVNPSSEPLLRELAEIHDWDLTVMIKAAYEMGMRNSDLTEEEISSHVRLFEPEHFIRMSHLR